MPPTNLAQEEKTCSRNHSLGFSTTTRPYACPHLKAHCPTSLAQRAGSHHTLLWAPPSFQGSNNNWGNMHFMSSHSCFRHRKCSAKLIYFPAKILTGNKRSVWCCTYYLLSHKNLMLLNWKQNCFWNTHNSTTVQANSPQTLLWSTFILHVPKTRKSDITLCTSITSNW